MQEVKRLSPLTLARYAILTACSVGAVACLLLWLTCWLARLHFELGSPTRLPIVLVDCRDGYCALWHIKRVDELIAARKHEWLHWWIVGGQRITAPVMGYSSDPKHRNRGHGYYILYSGNTAAALTQMQMPRSARVITHGRATLLKCSAGTQFLFFLGLALYPVIAFFTGPYRRRYRRRIGSCPQCGYNLTGNTSGVCPECGKQLSDHRVPKG